ncbi:2-methylthioadenine synthetase [Bacteroidetes bacterium UKL13-3]|jgi:threonylcarbamoyladenosine tRNA methylthiotransferase MtaB|nr:2-methylthioadenine synthetase [Bacteroidetes bacterium UKL13-3]HCP93865.1 tRNA (N(6)-L-threonylcarbamoyladenosine(37)-C(2))-methylthiotransferase MtaB [Bacteroidota bacterium]
MNKSVAFYTLGCKLNFSETSTIGRQLKEEGYQKVDFEQGADVYVINTCSVTDNADKKCKRIVKEALRHNPRAFVTIIGCYAQLKPKEIARIPGVDLVLGAAEKFNISEYLTDTRKKDVAEVKDGKIKEVLEYHASYSIGDRTRSFLKVQDGCDYFCSFCTIPLARGKSRSDTIANVVKQAKEVVESGIKEIVLTGVNTGDFGAQTGETFFDLLKALDEVEGLNRLRISSIEPNLLTDEIIEFVASSKTIVPHFHIPLQSGSDKILESMRRRYLTELYTSRVHKIKSLMPHCCIGIDVIVGFPSETHDDFLDTYNYLNGLDISYLHVFTYSERPNTTANKMAEKIPMHERAERSKMLHILSDKKRRYFYEQYIGNTRPVLWEIENDGNIMHGFTDNYIKVKKPYDPISVNEIENVTLVEIDAEMLVSVKMPALVF